MSEPAADDVRNDPAASRFVLDHQGVTAELIYERYPQQLIILHTEVPDVLGGSGIGASLVQAALTLARAEGLTVVPWCSFVRHWISKHPEAAHGVMIDWTTLP